MNKPGEIQTTHAPRNYLASPAFAVLLFLCGCISPPPERPPEIAGQEIPSQNIIIDFTKRYDVICTSGQDTRAYTNCRILGYTGDKIRDAEGKLTSAYSGSFGRWAVLEMQDGRRAFVPFGRITFLEEARR